MQATGKETPLHFQVEFENLKSQFSQQTGSQIQRTPFTLTDFSKFTLLIHQNT